MWLVVLPWTDGPISPANLITRGWADPQNHRSLRDGRQLRLARARRAARAGRFYDLTFDLQPDDQIIPAGKRIGLMIFSSDRDFTLWPAPGTELTIDLDRTSLRLPVVGGTVAVALTSDSHDADGAPASDSFVHAPSSEDAPGSQPCMRLRSDLSAAGRDRRASAGETHGRGCRMSSSSIRTKPAVSCRRASTRCPFSADRCGVTAAKRMRV